MYKIHNFPNSFRSNFGNSFDLENRPIHKIVVSVTFFLSQWKIILVVLLEHRHIVFTGALGRTEMGNRENRVTAQEPLVGLP